ncbi:sulfite exporter TauE/SafE family protein [Roseibium algae]|uniref:Probable membrane transporter protein n=1 Tax=Roseibium algae TaxID=3123038 RepID=A0ABU8TNQ2_9HYPH
MSFLSDLFLSAFQLPDALSSASAFLLITISFATSALTAALGLGGGIALLAIMASVMPIGALIPVHGVVQLGSNTGRALVQIRHLDRTILLWFTLGSILGAWIGGNIVVALPDAPLKMGLAFFILWSVWARKPKFDKLPRWLLASGGLVATFLTMFFGATGPVVGALISSIVPDRLTFVATHAACMTFQHCLKVIVFGLLGFAFAPWFGLLAAMIFTGFLGTLAGTHVLGRMPEAIFKRGFKLIMSLLALNLIWQAARVFMA